MVIIDTIHNYSIKRILLDEGSSIDNLYSVTIAIMNISKVGLKLYNGYLIDFSAKQVPVE